MPVEQHVRVGMIGTSWWADSMYLPAIANHPRAQLSAICGRNPGKAQQVADRWQIPHVFNHFSDLIESGEVDALIIATSNDTHYPITMRALQAGLNVLCEKPLALNYTQAAEMAAAAERAGVKHMVPFTYSFMPTARYLKELIGDGYLGQPYHLNMRYYTGYGREPQYLWRFDKRVAGAGVLGDLGAHWLYLAQWFYGEITGVTCQLSRMVERPASAPNGDSYEQGDDAAMLMLEFENGAHGSIHVTALAYEDTPFGQTHQMEFHGSAGTLYSFTDWDTVQRVSGARVGEGAVRELPVPDHIWGDARRDTVHNTYRDVFRKQDFMTRAFITAVAEDKPVAPNFNDGAQIQRIIEAALLSDRERGFVQVHRVERSPR